MNNTLFRIGTKDGWCTKLQLIGWDLPTPVAQAFHNSQTIQGIRDALAIAIHTAPEAVTTAIWTLCIVKTNNPPVPLVKPGKVVQVSRSGHNRILVSLQNGHMELRVKVKQTPKSNQMDLLVEDVG